MIRSEQLDLATGEVIDFDASNFFVILEGAGLQVAERGRETWTELDPLTVIGDQTKGALGPLRIKNATGGTVSALLYTSDRGINPHGLLQAQSVALASIASGLVLAVKGEAAHDASAAAIAPVVVGAEARSNERTAVTQADAARLVCDLVGRLVVQPYALPADKLRGLVNISAVGVVDLIAAQAAGVKIYLTSLVVANDAATDNVLIVLDGAAELFRVAVKAGATEHLTFPVPEETTAAAALRINVTAATSLRVRAVGYKGV